MAGEVLIVFLKRFEETLGSVEVFKFNMHKVHDVYTTFVVLFIVLKRVAYSDAYQSPKCWVWEASLSKW